jgi:2-polyprenyl-3-methyl-5-hydroxy-6-metoxy-1,4-benzoquinol methylase
MSASRDERINSFWKQAYSGVDDGGYISDDALLNHYRFLVEKSELLSFLEKYAPKNSRKRALDIGCGNGKFTEIMANYFVHVDAIDLSQEIITKNRKENKKDNCSYHCASLEAFAKRVDTHYDFIYIGGVLMYIDEVKIEESYKALNKLLNREAILVLRESVMSHKRVDNISESYIAYYREVNYYQKFLDSKLLEKKENLAYRTSELKNVLIRLKMGFLFHEKVYQKLLMLLKLKDKLWKPNYNKLVNYYYIFRR